MKSPVGPFTPTLAPSAEKNSNENRKRVEEQLGTMRYLWVFGYGRLEIVVLDFQASLRRAAPKISCYLWRANRRHWPTWTGNGQYTRPSNRTRGLRPGRANSNKNMTTTANNEQSNKGGGVRRLEAKLKRGQQYGCDDVKGQQLLGPSVFGFDELFGLSKLWLPKSLARPDSKMFCSG